MAGPTGNTIGGTASGAGNVASGNEAARDHITGSGTNLNVVVGNYAGTNAAGTAAVANQHAGILVQSGAQDNTIGGSAAADRNLVSGNVLGGIAFYLTGASGNVAEGNWVGLNAAGYRDDRQPGRHRVHRRRLGRHGDRQRGFGKPACRDFHRPLQHQHRVLRQSRAREPDRHRPHRDALRWAMSARAC